jgi:N-acetylated-alpha-linked acidic dipeptidase
VYDDFYWMNHFGDPGYKYHALMSRLWGVLALRLANADVLPFDFAEYARQLKGFVQALVKENPKARGKLDTRSLYQSLAAFESAGRRFDHAATRVLSEGRLDADVAKRLNRAIRQVELNWLHEEGIPGRPWFKHLLYGARYTYAHLELPGVTEAVEKGNWEAAQQQAALVEAAVRKNAQLLDDAVGELLPLRSGP